MQIQATLPNCVVFHSYNSSSYSTENPTAGIFCCGGHRNTVSNGSLKEPASKSALFDLQSITTTIDVNDIIIL